MATPAAAGLAAALLGRPAGVDSDAAFGGVVGVGGEDAKLSGGGALAFWAFGGLVVTHRGGELFEAVLAGLAEKFVNRHNIPSVTSSGPARA